jgi:hypothetical protein
VEAGTGIWVQCTKPETAVNVPWNPVSRAESGATVVFTLGLTGIPLVQQNLSQTPGGGEFKFKTQKKTPGLQEGPNLHYPPPRPLWTPCGNPRFPRDPV